jgi:hypothetical protein
MHRFGWYQYVWIVLEYCSLFNKRDGSDMPKSNNEVRQRSMILSVTYQSLLMNQDKYTQMNSIKGH